MPVLVTGCAGFIGYHVCRALLARGERVAGIDNLSPYYDVTLKEARLAMLVEHAEFAFARADIADHDVLSAAFGSLGPVLKVVHLAAQAGVRHSLEHPFAYTHSNIEGHLAILEACRHTEGFQHLVYASSSSVYGGNTKLPFSVDDRVDRPVSLYAATKRGGEMMSHAYSHLYGIPQTALRFFTVYGPWGRPDMAMYLFTKAILAGEPIRVFNRGEMARDFTYVDDVVAGTIAALDRPPLSGDGVPHRTFNLGNHRSEPLLKLIELIEKAVGKRANTILEPMQPGDVAETYANIDASQRDLGFAPRTSLADGVPRFVAWYREFYGV